MPLDVRGTHAVNVGIASNRLPLDFDYLTGRITASVLALGIDFQELGVVSTRHKGRDEPLVGLPAIGRDLEFIAAAGAGQLHHEFLPMICIAIAKVPRQGELVKSLESDEAI